jgi:hypothetical protein
MKVISGKCITYERIKKIIICLSETLGRSDDAGENEKKILSRIYSETNQILGHCGRQSYDNKLPGWAYRLPLWSSGQSSWLQIRRPGFDSRHYQIFWGKKKTGVGLERGPLSLVSTTEELLDRKVAAPV